MSLSGNFDDGAQSWDEFSESQLLEMLDDYRKDPERYAYDIEMCIECLGYDPDESEDE